MTARAKAKAAKKPEAKKPTGRPSAYSDTLAESLCAEIAAGRSLVAVCQADAMPHRATVMRWLHDDSKEGFRDLYARAREAQADYYAEQIIEIADEECTFIKGDDGKDGKESAEVEVAFDATAVARNRLRVDARKWYASKVAPKRYGDKIEQNIGGLDGGPLVVEITRFAPAK